MYTIVTSVVTNGTIRSNHKDLGKFCFDALKSLGSSITISEFDKVFLCYDNFRLATHSFLQNNHHFIFQRESTLIAICNLLILGLAESNSSIKMCECFPGEPKHFVVDGTGVYLDYSRDDIKEIRRDPEIQTISLETGPLSFNQTMSLVHGVDTVVLNVATAACTGIIFHHRSKPGKKKKTATEETSKPKRSSAHTTYLQETPNVNRTELKTSMTMSEGGTLKFSNNEEGSKLRKTAESYYFSLTNFSKTNTGSSLNKLKRHFPKDDIVSSPETKSKHFLAPVPSHFRGLPKCVVPFQIFFLEVVLEKAITNTDICLNAEDTKSLIGPLCNLAQALHSKNNFANIMPFKTAKTIVERNGVQTDSAMETHVSTCIPILYNALAPILDPVLIEVARKIVEVRSIVDPQMSPGDWIPFPTQPTVGETGPLKFGVDSHIFNNKVLLSSL